MDSLRAPMQKFAVSLFQACRRQQPEGNLLYSPMTASTGLLLILMGADGATRAEIESAMKLDDSPLFTSSTFEQDLKMAYRYTLAVINKWKLTEEVGETFQVFRVNKLFVDASISIRPDFVEQVGKLKGEISSINFKEDADGALDEINAYVDQRLNGKISECFKWGRIDEDTKMVLVNGICFRARWEVTFNPERTTSQLFYQMDGEPTQVEMMNGVFHLPYALHAEVGVVYVEIPYIQNIASLLIFLPTERGGIKQMARQLKVAEINKINLMKRMREVNLSLPRFKLATQLDMKHLFVKLGAKSLAQDKANLSRITDDHTSFSLSAATHCSFLSVNEKGTDADESIETGSKFFHQNPVSSFSGDKILRRTPSLDTLKSPPIKVTVDQPFLCAVRHNKSGLMMCLGRIEHL